MRSCKSPGFCVSKGVGTLFVSLGGVHIDHGGKSSNFKFTFGILSSLFQACKVMEKDPGYRKSWGKRTDGFGISLSV